MTKRNGKALHLVVKHLKQGIINREYLPGEKLTMIDIAEKLGISRIPVSEAFQDLEKQGLVELISNRGAFVKKYTIQDANNIYKVWTELEILSWKLLTENLNDKIFAKIEKNVNEQGLLANDENYEEFIEKDIELHLLAAKYSGNQFLYELIDNILIRIKMIRLLSLGSPARPQESYQEHLLLIKCVKEKNYELIEKHIRQHFESGFKHLERRMGSNNRW